MKKTKDELKIEFTKKIEELKTIASLLDDVSYLGFFSFGVKLDGFIYGDKYELAKMFASSVLYNPVLEDIFMITKGIVESQKKKELSKNESNESKRETKRRT